MKKFNKIKIINYSIIIGIMIIILTISLLIMNKTYKLDIKKVSLIETTNSVIYDKYYDEFLQVLNEGKFKRTSKAIGGVYQTITIESDITYNIYIYEEKGIITYTIDDKKYISKDKNYIKNLIEAIDVYSYTTAKLNPIDITVYKNKREISSDYTVDLSGNSSILLEINKTVKSFKLVKINSDKSESTMSIIENLKAGNTILYHLDPKKFSNIKLEVIDNYKTNIYIGTIINNEIVFEETTKDPEIVLSPSNLSLFVEDTSLIKIENYTGIVTWHSENEEIATIDENGNLIAVSVGKTRIYAITQNRDYIYLTVNVIEPEVILATKIQISEKQIQVGMGSTHQLSVLIEPEDVTSKVVQWNSTDSTVATVDENGIVSGHRSGKVIITARTNNGLTAQCEVTVIIKEVESITLNYFIYELKKGETVDLDVSFNPVDASIKAITWETDNKYIATVNEEGIVTAVATGTTKITAKTINGKTATCIISIIP